MFTADEIPEKGYCVQSYSFSSFKDLEPKTTTKKSLQSGMTDTTRDPQDQTWVSEYVIPLMLNCSPLFRACI
jgi:hypothetical protein